MWLFVFECDLTTVLFTPPQGAKSGAELTPIHRILNNLYHHSVYVSLPPFILHVDTASNGVNSSSPLLESRV